MIVALCVLGGLATVAGWTAVRVRHASVWRVMGVVNGVLGVAGLLTGRIAWADRVDPWVAAGVGAGAGLALYAATTAFVLVVRRWPVFDRHVVGLYRSGEGLSLPVALLLIALVYAPGEEIFWRGLVQRALASPLSVAAGAALAWAAYAVAESASGSLPIIAAGVVAGGTWAALALWTGGVVASSVCHVVWTGAMLAVPPGGRKRRAPGPDHAPSATGRDRS